MNRHVIAGFLILFAFGCDQLEKWASGEEGRGVSPIVQLPIQEEAKVPSGATSERKRGPFQVAKKALDTLLTPQVGIPTLVVVGGGAAAATAYYLSNRDTDAYIGLGLQDIGKTEAEKQQVAQGFQQKLQTAVEQPGTIDQPAGASVSEVFFLKVNEGQPGEETWVVKPMGLSMFGENVTSERELEKWKQTQGVDTFNAMVKIRQGHMMAFFGQGPAHQSLLPGKEVRNEVFAYALDQALGGHYQVPETFLVRLKHAQFNPQREKRRAGWEKIIGKKASDWAFAQKEELCSVQRFLGDMKSIQGIGADKGFAEINQFSTLLDSATPEAVAQFNFALIAGNSDGHLGNFLIPEELNNIVRIGLIDHGYSFLNPKVDKLRVTPMMFDFAIKPMSDAEYAFLAAIDVDQVMGQMRQVAEEIRKTNKRLKFSENKLNALKARLILAKIAGEEELTQRQWYNILDRTLNDFGYLPDNRLAAPGMMNGLAISGYFSLPGFENYFIETYLHEIHNRSQARINWVRVEEQLRNAALREKSPIPAFGRSMVVLAGMPGATFYELPMEKKQVPNFDQLWQEMVESQAFKDNPNQIVVSHGAWKLWAGEKIPTYKAYPALYVAAYLGETKLVSELLALPNINCHVKVSYKIYNQDVMMDFMTVRRLEPDSFSGNVHRVFTNNPKCH